MPITATILAAVLPMLTYLYFIWRADKYEPEPLMFVLLHFLWGAFGAVVLAIIGSQLLSLSLSNFLTLSSLSLFEVILIAPVVEELAKGSLLLKTTKSIKVDNLTDGLVYGGAIGLGFGMTENFMYFLSHADDASTWISLVIFRSAFSAVMHCIASAIFGAFLVKAKYTASFKKIWFTLLGFSIAVFIHFLWNFSVIHTATALFGFMFMAVLILFFITLFKISIKKESELIYNELLEESDLIPEKHLMILSTDKRNRKGWVDESLRKVYIKSATKLAFRKMEIKSCAIDKRNIFENEILKQRNIIRSLFQK
ncbi:MAG: PrsW family intramembrane metalloprotease [Ignavibacteriae bacterium]|nr:protease PrsW [Ignavibacteriota bacterium]NOG98728.1 PrsW family intramembrane metalloprotease [Ignavibacteriota bacterium]